MQQSSSNQHYQHSDNMAENIDKFMEFCKKHFPKKSSEGILKLVRKRFDECRMEYKLSSDFEKLLLLTQNKIRNDITMFFVHLKDFLNILKDNKSELKDHDTSKRERVHSESDSQPSKIRKVDSCSKSQNNHHAFEHNDHITDYSRVTDHSNLSDSDSETSVQRRGTDKSYNTSDVKYTKLFNNSNDNIHKEPVVQPKHITNSFDSDPSTNAAEIIVISDSESSSDTEKSKPKLDSKFDERLPVNDELNTSYKSPEDNVSDLANKSDIDHHLPARVESLPNVSNLDEIAATGTDSRTTPVPDMCDLKNDISATADANSITADATADHELKSIDDNKFIIRSEPLTSLEDTSNISTDHQITKGNEDKIILINSENIVTDCNDIDELDNNGSKLAAQDFKGDSKAAQKPEITPLTDVVSGGSKKKKGSAQQVRRLEILLEKLKNMIEKVRAKELCLDDLNSEVSPYILEDKLKQKFMKVWHKLCELNEVPATTDRPVDKYFRFQGTRYKAVNRRIEKFINRKKVFPDYHDIRDIVVKVNKKEQLNLRLRDIDDLSREAFIDVGNQLQQRRQKDFMHTIQPFETNINLTSMYDDPALVNLDLKKQLEANRKIGTSKMEQVIHKYSQLQYEVGDKTDSDEEEQEEDEEETELKKDIDLDEWLDISDTEAHTASTDPFPIVEIENVEIADSTSVDGYQFEYLDETCPISDSPLPLKEDADIQDLDDLTSKGGPDPVGKGEQEIMNNSEHVKCKQMPIHNTIDSKDECIEDESMDVLVRCSKHFQTVCAGDEPVQTINQLDISTADHGICKDITMPDEEYMSENNATEMPGNIHKDNITEMEGVCKTNVTATSDDRSLVNRKCLVSYSHNSRPLEDLVLSPKKNKTENKLISQDMGHCDNVKHSVSDHSNSVLSPSKEHIASTVEKSHDSVEDKEEIRSVSDIFEDSETEVCNIEPGDEDDHNQNEYPSIRIENVVGNVGDFSEPAVRKKSLDCVMINETDKNYQTLDDSKEVLGEHYEMPADSTYTTADQSNEDEISSTINPEISAVKLKHPDVRNKLLLLNKAIVDNHTESGVAAELMRTKCVNKVETEAQWIEDDENAGLIETYQEPECTPAMYITDDSTVSCTGQGDVIVLSDSE